MGNILKAKFVSRKNPNISATLTIELKDLVPPVDGNNNKIIEIGIQYLDKPTYKEKFLGGLNCNIHHALNAFCNRLTQNNLYIGHPNEIGGDIGREFMKNVGVAIIQRDILLIWRDAKDISTWEFVNSTNRDSKLRTVAWDVVIHSDTVGRREHNMCYSHTFSYGILNIELLVKPYGKRVITNINGVDTVDVSFLYGKDLSEKIYDKNDLYNRCNKDSAVYDIIDIFIRDMECGDIVMEGTWEYPFFKLNRNARYTSLTRKAYVCID